jgi:hypothetical protein
MQQSGGRELFLVLAGAMLLFSIWLPNLGFIKQVIMSGEFTGGEKWNLLIASLGALQTNFTLFSRMVTIVIAFLFGANMTLFVFYVKQQAKLQGALGIGFAGTIAGLLGAGCASCSSVILASIFGTGAAAGFVGILPLRGQEFGLLGIALLFYSIYTIIKKIRKPGVC